MADTDVIQTLVTALENRVKQIAEDAHEALMKGEVDFAKIKTAVGAELASLKSEIESLLSKAA